MFEWLDDLKIRNTPLFLDSRLPRSSCFISHAHSDHLGQHLSAISTRATAALANYRLGPQPITQLVFGKPMNFDADTQLILHSAGHVLGSAMLHVTRPEGTLLYTGDFKLRESATVDKANPVPADVLVMESTYGQPSFRFPPRAEIIGRLVDLVETAFRDNRQPIVLGYSLGKAQEIVRILTDAGFTVTCHGAVTAINKIYRAQGVEVGKTRPYVAADFHGSKAIDLRERGVLVAPPQVARTAFINRFTNPCRIMMSGWGLWKNAQYRYGVDHVLPLSDHADFDELLELIEQVQPKKIYTHHGFREFAQLLRDRGHDACTAKPDSQLMLFG